MSDDLRLDSAGVLQILKSRGVRAAVRQRAEQIAGQVRLEKPDAQEVVVDSYETDRAAASVTIRDARGRLWQVRDGVLTRAASSTGLEVTAR